MDKLYIIFCVVFTCSQIKAFTLQQRQQGDVYALECLTETGVNPVSVALLKVGDFSADDQRAKCFVRCFFQKEGFMNEQGNVDVEHITNALSSDFERGNVETVISKCLVDGKDACDTAFQVYECLYKNRESL